MIQGKKRRFPLVALNPFRSLPMVWRLGMLAEYRLSGFELERLPGKPAAPFRLVSMSGERHLPLLRESLHSFGRLASGHPALVLVSDGSVDAEGFRNALDFWPGEMEVVMPEQVMARLRQALRGPLETLARANPLGLKLAAVVALSGDGPQWFVDSDILWFLDPLPLMTRAMAAGGTAVTREDGCSMNRKLAEEFAPELLEAPSANTGCVLTTTDLAEDSLLETLLERALEDPGDEFNEQTILSILAMRSGGYLSPELCLVGFEDAHTVRRRWPADEGYCSRHYVRYMRHQFYRDAVRSHRKRIVDC